MNGLYGYPSGASTLAYFSGETYSQKDVTIFGSIISGDTYKQLMQLHDDLKSKYAQRDALAAHANTVEEKAVLAALDDELRKYFVNYRGARDAYNDIAIKVNSYPVASLVVGKLPMVPFDIVKVGGADMSGLGFLPALPAATILLKWLAVIAVSSYVLGQITSLISAMWGNKVKSDSLIEQLRKLIEGAGHAASDVGSGAIKIAVAVGIGLALLWAFKRMRSSSGAATPSSTTEITVVPKELGAA